MKLTDLRNIGNEMEKKLHAIDIYSQEELLALGSKEVFLRMKMKYPEVCLVHLYTIQGAIEGLDYNKLSQPVKDDLKAFSDSIGK